MNKKGFKLTLEGLVGLVLGIAFTVLIFFILFKLISVVVPGVKDQGTSVTVFNDINNYGDGETHFINFLTSPRTVIIGFNKDSNVLDLSSLNLDIINVRPVEIVGPNAGKSNGGYTLIKQLDKPSSCNGNSCICSCGFDGKDYGSINSMSVLCAQKIECVVLNNVDNIEFDAVVTRGNNQGKIFFLFNPSSDLAKSFLTLKKNGKTIFIK